MLDIKYEFILVRYGELSTKGKNRKDFIRQLKRNVKEALSKFKALEYRDTYDRLFITLNGENADLVGERLKHVFGISSFSFASSCPSDIESMTALATTLAAAEEGLTFKVITKRHDKHFPMSSDEINRAIAASILQNTPLKVDVHQPHVKVMVEVREQETYLMVNNIRGAQGYPVAVAGKALMMLSGGIDSPVASYLAMKRGIKLEAIHFASPPYTSVQALEKVKTLAHKLLNYQTSIKLVTVPFTEIQMEINRKVPESYSITIMRRFMIRLANAYALSHKCLAIVTGESVGQVASQTLESMHVISSVSTLPILRPVLTYDKNEIIDLSKKIDTYETSILPFEDCCTIFTPKKPTTKPHMDKAEYYEQKLDVEGLVLRALEAIEVEYIHPKTEEETFF